MTVARPFWQQNTLLRDFSPEEIQELESFAKEVRFEKGATLVLEGDTGENFFFITSGSLEVLKEGRQIHILEAGDVAGELAILGGKPRIATVRALETTCAKELWIKQLPPRLLEKLAHNLSYLFSTRLSITNQLTAAALRRELFQAKKRVALGQTGLLGISGVILFQVLLSFGLKWVPVPYLAPLVVLYMSMFALITFRTLLKNSYPISMFGLTWRNWKRSLLETFLFSIPLFLSVVVLKKILIVTSPAFANQPLFHLGLDAPALTAREHFWLTIGFVAYILGAPLQEFIFRGVTQTSWQRSSLSEHRTLIAILVSTLLYLSTHFYFSLSIAVVPPSLLWGYLFARHRTLVGVSVGHMLFGIWTFYIVGLNF